MTNVKNYDSLSSSELHTEYKNSSQIVIYQTEDGKTKLDVRLENGTVWLTQKLMSELFQTTISNINIHLKGIFAESELSEDKYLYKTKEKITKEGAEKSRFVKEGDFILSNSMSFGRPYIMKTKGYIHDGWFVLRLPSNIHTEFFWYLLASPYTMSQFVGLASVAIVKNISGDLVKKTKLPIPPFEEQKEIAQKLDALSTKTKQLEAIYQQKLIKLEELKKSILEQVFFGNLT